ncbi:MAG: hypothetical protein VB020_04080 [Methanocorpusculum sp.]|nr:hypothetical protein [Methanocorpusculum sp.]
MVALGDHDTLGVPTPVVSDDGVPDVFPVAGASNVKSIVFSVISAVATNVWDTVKDLFVKIVGVTCAELNVTPTESEKLYPSEADTVIVAK